MAISSLCKVRKENQHFRIGRFTVNKMHLRKILIFLAFKNVMLNSKVKPTFSSSVLNVKSEWLKTIYQPRLTQKQGQVYWVLLFLMLNAYQ